MTFIRQRMASVLTALALMAPAAYADPVKVAAEANAAPVSVQTSAGTVNINTADASTLAAKLEGVGQKKAEAIVQYRDQYGPFINAEDLSSVNGIGEATVKKNEAIIRIE